MIRNREIDFIHQGRLEEALNFIFPSVRIVQNARREASVKNPNSKGVLEVDLWCPDLKICFEYQDDHHYQAMWYYHKPLAAIQERDNIKRAVIQQRGETLIQIPCWWDGSISSLQATIQFYRPDVLPFVKSDNTITFNPAPRFFEVPEHTLMLASFPEENFTARTFIWWLGEKYDGIRCYWDPQYNSLISRHGTQVDTIPAVSRLFGSTAVDGEIWHGRGQYRDALVSIRSILCDWSSFRVVGFDESSKQMVDSPFEKRYALILSQFHSSHPIVTIATRFLCNSLSLLTNNLHKILEGGGEGIILRQPLSSYIPGRSNVLLKYKGTRGDQEALVVAVCDDNSLVLQLADGTQFTVPKESTKLHRVAKQGDIVEFSHDFKSRISTQGVPSHPIVFRFREDLSWEDVLQNSPYQTLHFFNDNHQPLTSSYPSSSLPLNLFPFDKGEKMKREIKRAIERAIERGGGNAGDVNAWYNLAPSSIADMKGIKTILARYGTLSRAAMDLFPELNLQKSKFVHEKSQQNKREWFERYAYSHGDDPQNKLFWYSVSPQSIQVRSKFGGFNEFVEALLESFSELNLDRAKFIGKEYTREWFEHFAQSYHRDSSDVNFWYFITNSTYHEKYKRSLDSFINTVVSLFPELRLDKAKFTGRTERKWFEEFALECKRDLGDKEFWYSVTPAMYNGKYQHSYYDFVKDVIRHFPELELEKAKFTGRTNIEQTQRDWFLRFATMYHSDPLDSRFWYSVTPSQLHGRYTGSHASFVESVIRVFPELNLDRNKFIDPKKEGLKNTLIEAMRESGGMDPLLAESWYQFVRKSKGGENKEIKKVVEKYGTLSKAAIDLFPDLNLQESKFIYDKKISNREWLERLASSCNANIEDENFWYSVTPQQVRSKFGGYDEFRDAVIRVFPELQLDRSKFLRKEFLQYTREWFEKFAYSQSADPLDRNFWYSVSSSTYGTRYKHSLDSFINTVILLFPELNLDRSKFTGRTHFSQSGRKWFENFARENNREATDKQFWYSVTPSMYYGKYKRPYSEFVKDVIWNFPELQFEREAFRGRTNILQTQREWFERFASIYHADPLNPQFWYSITPKKYSGKFAGSHNHFVDSVQRLFPELDLESNKFTAREIIL